MTHVKPDRETLLMLARSGDRAALADLLEEVAPELRSRLEPKITGEVRAQLDPDDVMQVTYIEALLRLETFREGDAGGFVAWLQHLAENNLIDAVRAMQAQKRGGGVRRVHGGTHAESMAGLAEVLAATSATPSRDAARGEGLSHLGRALELLPTDYRRAVSLYDLEGQSIEAVAAELGRSPGAVWMLRARAHDRLRDLMGSPQRFFSTPG